MKNLAHILIVSILTIITQIGGLIWIINFGYYRIRKNNISKWRRLLTYIILYLLTTVFIVPQLAKLNNRVALPITKSNKLIPHNYITPLLNRHYVKPALKEELTTIATQINARDKNLKLSYLDANFPFINGFPLLPHLSHSDGKKIDLTFYYKKEGQTGNLKPSNSGYGVFVEPTKREYHQTNTCKAKGYWQYDFTKYLTLGSRSNLEFDLNTTRQLVDLIVKKPKTQKLLIEPHLKTRLNLNNSKIRFQGCHAVRHDDHIHYQIN